MLLQGIQLPQTLPEAQEPLQAAKRPRTEPEQPAEQHQYKLPESTAGQAKQRQTSTGRPPLRPKAPAQSPMLVTSSAPGTSVQMVPNILIPAAPGFQGVPMLRGMPMVQGMPMVSGDVNDAATVTAYSCAGHQFTAFCTSCQSASHAQATLQENCRGKHLQEVRTVLKQVQRDIANTGAGCTAHRLRLLQRTVVRGNAENRFQIIYIFVFIVVLYIVV